MLLVEKASFNPDLSAYAIRLREEEQVHRDAIRSGRASLWPRRKEDEAQRRSLEALIELDREVRPRSVDVQRLSLPRSRLKGA